MATFTYPNAASIIPIVLALLGRGIVLVWVLFQFGAVVMSKGAIALLILAFANDMVLRLKP